MIPARGPQTEFLGKSRQVMKLASQDVYKTLFGVHTQVSFQKILFSFFRKSRFGKCSFPQGSPGPCGHFLLCHAPFWEFSEKQFPTFCDLFFLFFRKPDFCWFLTSQRRFSPYTAVNYFEYMATWTHRNFEFCQDNFISAILWFWRISKTVLKVNYWSILGLTLFQKMWPLFVAANLFQKSDLFRAC